MMTRFEKWVYITLALTAFIFMLGFDQLIKGLIIILEALLT